MKRILLVLALTACTVPEPPPDLAPSPARDCATLPTLKPGATRADMLDHIRITADLYARCAATP